ncbi:ABC transporter permease protein [Staphylococcus aureus]|nr:ABC transporter permease protein [Staphylococcus aureus]
MQQSVFNKKDIENKYKKQATLKQTGEIVSNGHQKDNVLVFGVEKSSFLVPSLIEGHKATKDNEVLADETLKNKGFKIGDTLSLSQSDEKLHIVGFTESAKYNASSVIFTNDATIAKINPRLTGDKINAVVVRDTNWKDKKLNQELEAVSINDFIENLPGYKPQNLTLNFMISFLFVISATVIGIFLYVMTLQKTSLFGILKAQGFTNGYLANVVISQTLILALFGTAFGLLLTGVTGAFLPDAVPVKFDVLTLLVFAIVLMIVSVLGSLFSILTIRKIDPLKAIG